MVEKVSEEEGKVVSDVVMGIEEKMEKIERR